MQIDIKITVEPLLIDAIKAWTTTITESYPWALLKKFIRPEQSKIKTVINSLHIRVAQFYLQDIDNLTQHENGDLRKIKVCVNLRKVGHPTLRKLSTARKGL